MVGVGYRRELATWLDAGPVGLDCLEITAEHFYDGGADRLAELAGRYSLFVHGLGLSLGTPGPLDPERLQQFARVAQSANARWISEHVAFTRTKEVDLGHLHPVRPTREAAKILADHACELSARCGLPLLLENITSHLRLDGEMTEPEFLNEVAARAGCGLLLDVTNLYINSRNHGFDPLRWLDAVEASRIRQLHIVGYSERNGRLMDDHAAPIQPELLDLAAAVMARAPVEAIILERDAAFPPSATLDGEVAKLSRLCERN